MTASELKKDIQDGVVALLEKRWLRVKNRKLVLFPYLRMKLLLKRLNAAML